MLQQPRRGAALGRRLGLMAGEAAAAAAAARGGPGAGGGCRAGPGRAANPRSRSRTAEAEPARGWAGRGITCPQHAHVPPPRARAGRELEAAGGGCRARPHRGHAGGQVIVSAGKGAGRRARPARGRAVLCSGAEGGREGLHSSWHRQR